MDLVKAWIKRFVVLFILFVMACAGSMLMDITDSLVVALIPLGVGGLIIFLLFNYEELRSHLENRKEQKNYKSYYKDVRKSGLSEGEYLMTTLPKDVISSIETYAGNPLLLEKHINSLAFKGVITYQQADVLKRYHRYLRSDKSEGAYVLSILHSSDFNQLQRYADNPRAVKTLVDDMVKRRVITSSQAKALLEYHNKLNGSV